MNTAIKSPEQRALILPQPDTKIGSCLMMKKLTGVCVSTIAYVRNLFDESDFAVRSFKGIPVRIVKGNINSPGGQCLSNWLLGAFDAIEKNYLKALVFEILDEGVLLESYSFSYTYKGEGGLAVRDKLDSGKAILHDSEVSDTTSNDVSSLLRNLLVALSNKPRLPSKCTTSVRITYHDETPETYEPPGFKPFNGDKAIFKDLENVSRWNCGRVSTSFHTLTVRCRQNNEIDSPSPVGGDIVCPCGLKDCGDSMLKCETCGTLQHLACSKIFYEENSQSQRTHTCQKCSGSQSSKHFDSAECVFRRVLSLGAKEKSQTISISKLINHLSLDPDSAMLYMRRLQREGALQKSVQPITTDKSDFLYKIDKTALLTLKSKYFN